MITQRTIFLCSIPHLHRGRVYSATPLPLSCVSIVLFADCMGRHLRRIPVEERFDGMLPPL